SGQRRLIRHRVALGVAAMLLAHTSSSKLAMSWRCACQSTISRFRWNHINVSRRGCLPAMNCSIDLPPLSRTNRMEVRSVNQENDGYEEESIYRATDRWLS